MWTDAMDYAGIQQNHRGSSWIQRTRARDDPEESVLRTEPQNFLRTSHRGTHFARRDSIDQRALATARSRDLSCAPLVNFFHFGQGSANAESGLFGSFHPSQASAPKPTAVLLCNPFGEEAVRAHRIYRVLANRLSRAGHAVLRFDYLGTGDSSGSAEETNLDDWIASVVMATAELRRLSSAPRIAALGLRLGGTLAAIATSKHSLDLQHLLLWDPVIDGPAYLRELAASHVEYMSEEMGSPYPPPPLTPEGFPHEALGYPLPPSLLAQIAKIDLAAIELRADHVTVVTTRSGDDTKRLESRLEKANAKNTKWIATSTSVPWNSDAAVNSAVVPMDILEILVARIQELG
ncbi:MAG: alpha/beta fold hydrolase [Polyangiales bacterium]